MNNLKVNNFIAIFGGTFDPIHLGHLNVAEQICQKLPIDEVRFIPCYQSPTRQCPPIATAEQRLAMLKLATVNHSHYLVDDRELVRQGPSYMIDTLKELKSEQNENVFALVLGMDAFADFDHWRDWQNILTLSHLILVDRPNYQTSLKPNIAKLLIHQEVKDSQKLLSKNFGNIIRLDIVPKAISATMIREKIFKKQGVKDLIPPQVWL